MIEITKGGQGYVPVPNALFDQLLPKLTDCELRVLLVVVRSTRGWREKDSEGRWRSRRRDWLTNRQLALRSGRSSAAVSRAVQSLVKAGVIVVEDGAGRPLLTPQERRGEIGRLYYRLGDMWITPSASDIAQVQTTTYRRTYKDAEQSEPDAARPDRGRSGWVRSGSVGAGWYDQPRS